MNRDHRYAAWAAAVVTLMLGAWMVTRTDVFGPAFEISLAAGVVSLLWAWLAVSR